MIARLPIATALLALSVTGCATTTAQSRPTITAACDHPERDLTRVWAERRYWCVPESIRLAHHVSDQDPYRDHEVAPAVPPGAAIASFSPDFFGPRP